MPLSPRSAAHRRRIADEDFVDGGRPLEGAVLLAKTVDVGGERLQAPRGLESRRREGGERAEEAPVLLVEGLPFSSARLTVEEDEDPGRAAVRHERRADDALRARAEDGLVGARQRSERPAEIQNERIRRGGRRRRRGKADRRDRASLGAVVEGRREPARGVEDGDRAGGDLVEQHALLGRSGERSADVVERLEPEDLLPEVEDLLRLRRDVSGSRQLRVGAGFSGTASPIRFASPSAGAKRGLRARTGFKASVASSFRPRSA